MLRDNLAKLDEYAGRVIDQLEEIDDDAEDLMEILLDLQAAITDFQTTKGWI